jgi:hypothetical protein
MCAYTHYAKASKRKNYQEEKHQERERKVMRGLTVNSSLDEGERERERNQLEGKTNYFH